MTDQGRRPKDMTVVELQSLPDGPYERRVVPLTGADRARGMKGKTKEVCVYRPVCVNDYEAADLLLWEDPDTGMTYSFGQWADGRWFKTPEGCLNA